MPPRVVTTVPAATEIVAALGVTPVGISHACDYPPTVTDTPVVTTPTDSGAFTLRDEHLTAADPELVVCQGTCADCAIDRSTVQTELAALPIDPSVVSIDVHCLADLYTAIKAVGRALGRPDRAATLVDRLQARVDSITRQAPHTDRPRVAVFDWLDPVMVAGHWVPELVAAAGGSYELESTGAPARPRSWERIREYDPEVIIVAPCGYDLAQTTNAMTDLTERPGWEQLRAVQTDAVYLLDGDQYVNRPGPRLPATLRHIAGLVHPDVFTVPPRTVARPAAVPTTAD